MIDYAKAIGASEEVLNWCDTTLKAAREKQLAGTQEEVEHIIDFLASNSAPKRLKRMSYAQAKVGAEKWSKANQKRGRNLTDDDEDLKTLHEFDGGSRIVQLLTKKAYEREGFFMAHCVGGYEPDNSTIYSYRDEKNEPHATFEVSKEGDEIVQIKGKGNGAIHPKYIQPILTFLNIIGMKVRPSDMKHLGYYHITDEYEELLNLFVDEKGNKPKVTHLLGHKYLYSSAAV